MTTTLPLFPLRFRTDGTELQYKPYPAYPTWLLACDFASAFAPFVYDDTAIVAAAAAAQSTADGAVSVNTTQTTNITAAAAAAAAAQSTADGAVSVNTTQTTNITAAAAAAAAAQATADAAQATADKPKNRRWSVRFDECNFSVTPTRVIDPTNYSESGMFINTQHAYFTAEIVIDLTSAHKWFFLGTKYAGAGQLDVYLDGVGMSTLDFYSPTLLYNQALTIGWGANALTAGRHVVKGIVDTKNASSSGYGMALIKIYIKPNVD